MKCPRCRKEMRLQRDEAMGMVWECEDCEIEVERDFANDTGPNAQEG